MGYRDVTEDRWHCYEVSDAAATTICDFLHGMVISEIDPEGQVVVVMDFHNAPTLVQCEILRLSGLTWKDVEACGIPGDAAKRERPASRRPLRPLADLPPA